MTAVAPPETAEPPPPTRRSALERYYALHPTYRLTVRWALIVVATGVAFHQSIVSLAMIVRNGSIGGFVWTVPAAAILVAVSIARRKRTELPIHDRQTDIIVGLMGLGLAVLIQSVLLPRYDLYFDLLRLDLIAMWLFVSSSAVVLFGLRPVIRFAWVWVMSLLLILTLPYYLVVIALGGGNFAAGSAALLIAGFGVGIAAGPEYLRATVASFAAWAVGFVVLGAIGLFFRDAPVLVYQEVPALSAICLVGLGVYLLSRRGQPKKLLDRKVEPLAAKQVWAAVPLIAAVAVALARFPLPEANATWEPPPAGVTLAPRAPLEVPKGWVGTGDITRYPVNRLYGPNAVLVRQYVTAQTGNPRWDKMARPRTVVVDSTVSERPHAFNVFPSRVLYSLTAARLSDPIDVDLGHGITGRLRSVVDDELLVTWDSLTFYWGRDDLAQRVTVFAVDNHDPDAPFPEPGENVFPTLRTLVTLLFRGNDVLDEKEPQFKDAELLTVFGRALVDAQIGRRA